MCDCLFSQRRQRFVTVCRLAKHDTVEGMWQTRVLERSKLQHTARLRINLPTDTALLDGSTTPVSMRGELCEDPILVVRMGVIRYTSGRGCTHQVTHACRCLPLCLSPSLQVVRSPALAGVPCRHLDAFFGVGKDCLLLRSRVAHRAVWSLCV